MFLEFSQKVCPNPLHINSKPNRENMGESRGAGEKIAQDCWTLMTRAEKFLLFLLILALLALIGLATFIIIHFLEKKDCDSPECIKASYELLKTTDFNIDPCEDFHSFICGNYIPTYDEKKVDLVIDDFHEDDSYSLTMVKTFYQACTNTTAIDEGTITLSALVSQIGDWPLLLGEDWNEENFNWLRFMAFVRTYGVRSDWLLSFDYYKDEKSNTNLLQIGPPKLKPTSHQFNYYAEIITKIAKMLGTTTFIQSELHQMIRFEHNLSSAIENAQNNREDSMKIITVAELNDIWPENLLFSILNELGRGFAVFTNNTLVVVSSQHYIFRLHSLLSATPKRTQANYLVWKIIETYLPFLTDDIRDIYGTYFKLESREKHCHAETSRRFHSVIEDEYVGKYKNENSIELLQTMITLIHKSHDKSENKNAKLVIEGPEGKYSGVTSVSFNSNKIIRMINAIEYHIDNEFYKCLHRNFHTCVNEGYYEDTEELKTYFDISDNTIHLPYNLVYSDSFMWDRPNYINFAKIGRVVGDKIKEAEEERINKTIDEVGVDLAYEGYVKWIQNNGLEQKLPALNYSTKQLFWMFSNIPYCSFDNNSEKFEEVENSQYFKEDFNCS